MRRACLILAPLSILGFGCSGPGLPSDSRQASDDLARDHGFDRRDIAAGEFTLRSYSRGHDNKRLVVYIEGDGAAWRNRYQLSMDPTPRQLTVLRMAIAEPAPAVAYIARPCQFVERGPSGPCAPHFWSSHRYGTPVIDAIGAAIDILKSDAGAARLTLIGYSGGGVIATLLAAGRGDVDHVMTVAANLDHAAWTRYHGVSPLLGSLNPVAFAAALDAIPQTHLVGADDDKVPESIVQSYIDALSPTAPVKLAVLPDYNHECCWADDWARLRQHYGAESH